MSRRTIRKISRGRGQHWVGDGFPVNSMFSYGSDEGISPFLLLDHAGPAEFTPAETPRGVGMHPHRGFETVTIVYDGEVAHKDTAGNSGVIGKGDVQWMTAARGVLHEEFHSEAFTQRGGRMHMVQLWVNLPAKDKMSAPRYQEILNTDIPVVPLPGNAGLLRVIAGDFSGANAPAKTFTPIHMYDVQLNAGGVAQIPMEDGFNIVVQMLEGSIRVGDEEVHAPELAIFASGNGDVEITATADAKFLFLAGEPINEPVVGAGPFVMNTESEIHQAFADFRAGRLQ
jgi:redox-sensitive bicupin YhaK (pirin superfamily)